MAPINQYLRIKGLYKKAENVRTMDGFILKTIYPGDMPPIDLGVDNNSKYDVVKEYKRYLPKVTSNEFIVEKQSPHENRPSGMPTGPDHGLAPAPDRPVLTRKIEVTNDVGYVPGDTQQGKTSIDPFVYKSYGNMRVDKNGKPEVPDILKRSPEEIEKTTRDYALRSDAYSGFNLTNETEPYYKPSYDYGYNPLRYIRYHHQQDPLDYRRDPKGWKELAEMVGKPELFKSEGDYKKNRKTDTIIGGGLGALGGYVTGGILSNVFGWNKPKNGGEDTNKIKRRWLKGLSTLGGTGLGAYLGYNVGKIGDRNDFEDFYYDSRRELNDALDYRLGKEYARQIEEGKGAAIESLQRTLPEFEKARQDFMTDAKGTVADSPEYLKRWYDSQLQIEANRLRRKIYGEE